MPHINSPTQIKSVMESKGLKFHKGLGQNFLFDEHFLNKIVECGDITKEDTVLEIGPGLGVLTTRLAEKAKKVIAVELDKYIVPVLSELTNDFDNIEIINNDILKVDVNQLIKNEKSVKIVANLPYYITTPIIMKLLEEKVSAKSIVIMIQKEVAERIVAEAGSKDYGAITLAVNYYSNPSIMFIVPPTAFVPPPKVESAVLKLEICPTPNVIVSDEKILFKVIKAAFGQRRKTLVNAISAVFSDIPKSIIRNIIIACSLNENCRGETLTLQNFANISEKIIEIRGNKE